jgi:hypothetical protein
MTLREIIAAVLLAASFTVGVVCRGWYDGAVIDGLRADKRAYESEALRVAAVASEAQRVAAVAQEQASAARRAIRRAPVAATCEAAVDQLYESLK